MCLGRHRSSYPSCLVATPPPPRLTVKGESAAVLLLGRKVSLGCAAPLEGVEFQLRRGDKELLVNRWSTTPGRVFFDLKLMAPGEGGLYTCRYHLRGEQMPWSADSEPVELLLSDGEPGAVPWGVGETPREGPPGLQDSGSGPVPTNVSGLSFPIENETVSSATSRPHEE